MLYKEYANNVTRGLMHWLMQFEGRVRGPHAEGLRLPRDPTEAATRPGQLT